MDVVEQSEVLLDVLMLGRMLIKLVLVIVHFSSLEDLVPKFL